MSSILQGCKLRFLDKAARHYAISAPSTSAHLMLQRNVEVNNHSTAIVEGAGSTSCKACGTLLLPGSTARVFIESAGVKRFRPPKRRLAGKRGQESKADDKKHLIVECRACHRYGKYPLPANVKSTKNVAKPTKAADLGLPLPTEQSQDQMPTSKNASSKQRAKARKGGLQRILEKSRQGADSTTTRPDLNLMDFMRRD